MGFQNNVNTIVLVIDSDLALVFWLGRTLAEVGYEVFPAKSVAEAFKLIAEFQLSVALLIVRDSLPGADDLIAILRYTQKDLKVILSVADVDDRVPLNADAQCRRPHLIDENSKTAWLQVIQKVLWDKSEMLSARQRSS